MHPQDRLFCEIAVQLQLLTREQMTRCVQVQEQDAAGQSIATIASALGYMNQAGVDSVVHQQQRVLERRREAREASRLQREAESRAAAGLAQGHAPAPTRTSRTSGTQPPNPASGIPDKARDATPTAPSSRRAPERQRRPTGTWSEARQTPDTTRETLDERPPARASGYARGSGGSSGPPAAAPRHAPAARAASSASFEEIVEDDPPPAARGGSTARGARGTLLETSGMEQKRRELAAPAGVSGRPVPSGRDWRNPSQPPPPNASFDVDTPAVTQPPRTLQPRAITQPPAVVHSSKPPAGRPVGSNKPIVGTRSSVRAPALDGPDFVQRALELCARYGASDFHLHAGAQPRIRIDGKLHPVSSDHPVSTEAIEQILGEALDDAERMQLFLDGELRRIYTSSVNGMRARMHALASERGLQLLLHLLPNEVPTAAQLGLGHVLRLLRDKPSGLCLCTGPAGAGVTSTLWALGQALATERSRHIVSLESPLELHVTSGLGLFEQREVGRHVESYAAGIEWALSEGADVIVVGDILAPGAFEASLRTSSARCLVLGGLRASSSVAALRRLLCDIPGDPDAVRGQLADSLRVLLHQRLLPRLNPPGCIAAFESLFGNAQLAQLIRQADLVQLTAALDAPSTHDRISLGDALLELVRSSAISGDTMRAALSPALHQQEV